VLLSVLDVFGERVDAGGARRAGFTLIAPLDSPASDRCDGRYQLMRAGAPKL